MLHHLIRVIPKTEFTSPRKKKSSGLFALPQILEAYVMLLDYQQHSLDDEKGFLHSCLAVWEKG
jgi:hypothetical protein